MLAWNLSNISLPKYFILSVSFVQDRLFRYTAGAGYIAVVSLSIINVYMK